MGLAAANAGGIAATNCVGDDTVELGVPFRVADQSSGLTDIELEREVAVVCKLIVGQSDVR